MSDYNIRYTIARAAIHFGLWIMPKSAYKTRLLEVLWDLNREVHEAIR